MYVHARIHIHRAGINIYVFRTFSCITIIDTLYNTLALFFVGFVTYNGSGTHHSTVGRMGAAVFKCYELQLAMYVPLNGHFVFRALDDR